MLDDRLSLFHSELLRFLQQDISKQREEEGLLPLSSDEPLPLTEIIENHHYLFGAQGTIPTEKLLMKAFPVNDFIRLGLTRYYPRMYRGLPRLYHKNYPAQSYIKKNFVHLPSLKRQAVSKALYSLYNQFPAQGKVCMFTWVIGDGFGDYFAALEAMRLLRGRFPELELHFIALVQEKMAPHLPRLDGTMIIPYEKEAVVSPEAMKLLASSDLILQMPTFFPHTAGLMKSPMPKMEFLGEYGFLESSWFHPKSGGYSMGLHFLEKGILTRKPRVVEWSDVKNERLNLWRNPEHHFYLAYLATPMGGKVYLHALLKSLEADERGVDLCVPDLDWFIQFVQKQKNSILEWDLGVESIEIYFEDRISSIPISPKGKKVRLLCPGPISHTDFQAMLLLSNQFVAVRGNQSFSEAISAGKTFFYDGRDHARYLIKDLVALAENRIGSHPTALTCLRGMNQCFLYNLPVQEEDWVDETFFQEKEEWTSIALKIGLALQDPETISGFQKLGKLITEEFSCNNFLCHLVQRALCHKKYPQIEKLEENELALFTSNAQSFAQLIENQKNIIQF